MILEFNDVSFAYGEKKVLDKISFGVEKGEFVAIIGPSGCGKSTLFRLINRLEALSGGEILFNGDPIPEKGGIAAFMPQRDLLLPWRTVLKNVMLPFELKKQKGNTEQALDILGRVGLGGCENMYPSELSGGMRQRASFARTLCTGGELMLLDEPFSALDSLTRTDMQDWLLKQKQTLDKTVILVTHDIDEALLLADTVYLMVGSPVTSLKKTDASFIHTREELYRQSELKTRLLRELGGKDETCA